jgi:catechol 2,3-dioxygenase-like lactoylglutathione lyase family enzyme
MSITYDGLLTCAINVTDLARSIEWYTKTLGFELMYQVDEIGWCEMSTPIKGVQVGLSQTETAGGAGGATCTFGTTDVAAAKAHLDLHGVRQDGPIQEYPGLARLLTFFDPDDNTLMLAESLEDAG